MRRIPRPSGAIEPCAALSSCTRQRILPSPCTHLRTSTATFSTTSSQAFLVPGKQDKKKHQQFVRRWQKRLLGDSEPIGAHVDPYDPTSPIRIAPEEQGEYEEVLEERSRSGAQDEFTYLPAEELGAERPGAKLMRVGGEEWQTQKWEGDLAKEFEKLTQRTYTPLTLDMANEIEELTGTPYTLRDDNLMMAQNTHELTGRPYTTYDFGLHRKITKLKDIRSRFVQAVAEVYTLKEAGLQMDLSKTLNRGVYDKPRWIEDIKFRRTESGELALAFPEHKSAQQFLKIMQQTPEWESTVAAEADDLLVEEGADFLEPAPPQEPAPTMDPATPAFKRAAVVKIDPEKKPFDFMSNRPTPRVAPTKVDKAENTSELPVSEPKTPAQSPIVELVSAVHASQSVVSDLRHSILQHKAQRLAENLAAIERTVGPNRAGIDDVKWRHIPVTDPALKFALFKRLYQLTGLRISDPHLTSAKTLGDLYGHLCAAAKPQATSLYSAIHIEGQKARERAKQQAADKAAARKRADLGDLITLGNVELRRVKATKTEKRTKTGMDKVLQYALWERGLAASATQQQSKPADENALGFRLGFKNAKEGSREVPEFGKVVSSKGATLLAKRTRKQVEDLEAQVLKG